MNPSPKKPLLVCLALVCTLFSGCMSAYVKSVGGETDKTFSRIYLTDFNTAWQAILEGLKSSPMDVTNREAGYIQTKWVDNTAQKNLADSFGPAQAYLKAKYRVKVTATKGFYNGVPSVKITVRKEQVVQRDVLEGWKPVSTDEADEKTFLYRIGRLIFTKMKLAQIEEQRVKAEIQEFEMKQLEVPTDENGENPDFKPEEPPPSAEAPPPPSEGGI